MTPIRPLHWQTARLVDLFRDFTDGQQATYEEMAKSCDTSVAAVKVRLHSVREILLRDHHVIVETIRKVGVRRIPQGEVTRPVAAKRSRIRSAAAGGRRLIASGVTDWEQLPPETRTQLLTDSAVLGTIVHATDHNTRKKILGQVEANGQQSIGKVLELMK